MEKLKKLSIIALTCVLMSLAISTLATATDPYDWDWSDTTADEEAAALFGLSMIACGIFVLIWYIIFIAIAIWVYKDAEKRGKSGALWLIIVILLNIIGIIIWLIVRPPIGGEPSKAGSGRMCPNCGRPIPMDAQVCPYCGKSFQK